MLLTKSSVATREMNLCEGHTITHAKKKLEETGLFVQFICAAIFTVKLKIGYLNGHAEVPKSSRSPSSGEITS
jgi:hypothetical protein